MDRASNHCMFPSSNSTASLQSSESNISSCSDISVFANSDDRTCSEECSGDSSQEVSSHSSMHRANDGRMPPHPNGYQQPFNLVRNETQKITAKNDTSMSTDSDSVVHCQEGGDHDLGRGGPSIQEKNGTSYIDEMNGYFWLPPDAYEDGVVDSVANYDDDDDDDECGGDMSWGRPSSLTNLEEGSETHRFKDEKQKAMEEVMNGKFKALVGQLLKSAGVVSSGKDGESWVDIVTSLSWQAATFVKPDVTEGKAMDPDGYVKIKCVASGFPNQSKLIRGLVFKKHAAHKHMPTMYKNPRLLLIQGALGLSSSGLLSFESMHQDSLKPVIDVIEKYQANVVLVEKTVARVIQESILAKKMTLVLDMKLHRLERVARFTGSPILSLDVTVGQNLRQCDSFRIEKFVEEHAACGEGEKRPSKTLMFLEGCPTRLGCTILLMGANRDCLKRIKCVIRWAVVMAYHFILETYFLLDLKAMFSTIALSQVAELALCNQDMLSISPICTTSSNKDSIAESDVISISDVTISDVFQEEGHHYLNSEPEANSSFLFELYNPAILSGLSSLSASLKRVMGDSFPALSSQETTSTYLGFDERKLSDQGQAAVQVPTSHESFQNGNKEPKSVDIETVVDNNVLSRPPSTSSEAPLETHEHNGDYEDPTHNKDEIKMLLDSESILVLMSSRNASKGTMCEHSHFSHIKFYRNFDVPLGKFLRDNLLNQKLQCKTCGEPPEAHLYYYAHHNKQLTIQVRRLPLEKSLPGEFEGKLWMWSRCGKCKSCNEKSTKRVLISTAARGLSFGKFLELSFSTPSSSSTKSNCGHSIHKDFLYFFGLGPMVSMFKYSTVANYSISLPPQKLEFGNPIKGDSLKDEFKIVYKKGKNLFLDVEKSLEEIRPRFLSRTLNLQGKPQEFCDVEDILKQERSQFEVDILNAEDENDHEAIYKPLRLNRVRFELLLESRVWDRRLCDLTLSDVLVPNDNIDNSRLQTEDCASNYQLEDNLKDVAVEDGDASNVIPNLQNKVTTCGETIDSDIIEVPIDELRGSSIQGGSSSISFVTGDNRNSVATTENSSVTQSSSLKPDAFQADYDSSHSNVHSFCPPQSDEIFPNTSDIDGGPVLELNHHSSFSLENNTGWIWAPFTEIRRAYMKELGKGYLPKFDPLSSLALDSMPYRVVSDDGFRLHIPLGSDNYVVSDYEDELSSIIACALALLKDLPNSSPDLDEDTRRERVDNKTNESSQSLSLASPHWSSTGSLDLDGIYSSSSISLEGSRFSSFDGLDLLDSLVSLGAAHPEVSLGTGKSPAKRKYSVVCLYASQFRQLRNRCCPSEIEYIASLSRCKDWDAKGGKSKSFFSRTLDERFIIKEIKRTEFESFLKFGPNYFEYMNECYEQGNQTCLAKILGIYQVITRQSKNGKENRHDLMVMENLSYGRNIVRHYDLKGALHARFNSSSKVGGDVLLDQNFVNDMNVSPLYVSRKSKRHLQRAVWNDTTFLNNINVMDYSLLVGVDSEKRELVCGIIDYLRQYTWDKQLENWVKSSLVVPKNQQPTVISPIEYKKRFRKFIDTYFLSVPDHWCSHRSSNPCKLCGTIGEEDCSHSRYQDQVSRAKGTQ